MTSRAKIRLYVEVDLGADTVVALDAAQAHYLFGVMRQAVGAQVLLFNGRHGEWLAEVVQAGKRKGLLTCTEQTAPLHMPPDLWLIFAPIKKARTAFIVEKAVEMGAARIIPALTRFTNSERWHPDRMQAHTVEAAEQCRATYVPEIAAQTKLDTLLVDWPADRQLMFCDESRDALPAAQALAGKTGGPWAIIIGPEGGFSDEESAKLRNMPQTTSVTLGPRILRADTAVIAAMTAWQQVLGDWR